MKMIECISLLCEMLAMLLVLHKLLHKKFCLDKITILFLLIDVVMFWMININLIPNKLQFVIYIIFIFYMWIEFQQHRIIRVIIYTIINVLIIVGLQIMVYMMLFPVHSVKMRIVLSNIIMLCIVVFAIHFGKLEKIYIYALKSNSMLSIMMIICGVLFFMLIVLSKAIESFSFLNCLLMYVIFLLILVFCQQWKSEKEKNVSKEREIRVLRQCNESFEHLINDVRSKQHGFNNQLEAIFSLQYVCNTYDELVKRQKTYISHILDENVFNKLLISKCPPVVKGFLYYKFCEAHQAGINIDYEIELRDIQKPSLEFDIQEVIGILFDNACEAVENNEDNRIVQIAVMRKKSCVNIRVENPFSYMTQSKIQEILNPGYSSKGKNRGYGLSNVKQIAKKYNGMITIENKNKQEENWFSISIELIDF